MTPRAILRTLDSLLLAATVLVCAFVAHDPNAQDDSPLSEANVAASVLLDWDAIEVGVRKGVLRGVRAFHFRPTDREEVTARAMARAWRVFAEGDTAIHNPEGWGMKIAERVGLDELRRQKRDRLRAALPLDADVVEDAHVADAPLAERPDPFAETAAAERRALLCERIDAWPEPERTLARILLDGRADTITAAAWLYREAEEAAGGEGTMYPKRARTLLEARRRELQDLA